MLRIVSYVCCSPVRQFHVGLFPRILAVCLGQLLGDDKLGDVHTVTQQVGDRLLGMLHCTIRVPVSANIHTITQQVRDCLACSTVPSEFCR